VTASPHGSSHWRLLRNALVSALACFSSACSGSDSSAPPGPAPQPLPSATGDLAAFVKTGLLPSISNVSGSGATADPNDQHNEYILPTAGQLQTWRTVFERILGGDYRAAHTLTKSISSTYNLVEYTDSATAQRYYVLMEGVPGNVPAPAHHATSVSITNPDDPTRRGWGTYIINPSPRRLVSFSAPHPKDDLETADQAIEAFLDLGAHSLLIAGADRDQNTALAPCEQSSRPYLEADVAHTADSVFQIAFETIFASNASLHHLQFHGNDSCAVDIFLSNGVENPLPIFYALRNNIVAASQSAAGGGSTLTADVYDSPPDCTLRGRQNVQMRFAAGIPHNGVCTTGNNPTVPTRFIHMEQLRIARRAPSDPLATPGQNRNVVRAGIKQSFP
jgi:hypothetical protein